MVKHTGPLLGYNNNVPYKGSVYHVQTEDSGSKRPHVITHLFADGGRIVKTKKTSYAQFVGSENLTERVRTLMRTQHKQMVVTLRGGDFDHFIEPPEGADPRELAKQMVERAELSPDAPIEATSAPSDDRDFQREMESIAGEEKAAADAKGAAAARRALEAQKAAAEAEVAARAQLAEEGGEEPEAEKETTYKYVGRPAQPPPKRPRARSAPPGRSTPPPAKRGAGALPLTRRARPEGDGTFGSRYAADRRFDELVMAFFARG